MKLAKSSKFILILLVFGGGLIILYKTVCPSLLKEYLIKKTRRECESCELTIEELNFSLFPGKIVFRNARLKGHTKDRTVTDAFMPSLEINVNIFELLRGRIELRSIRAMKPVVTLMDSYEASTATADAKKLSTRPNDFSVGKIRVEKATFIYNRIYPGQNASINIYEIDAEIGKFGSSDDLFDQPLKAKAQAVFEKSGRINLDLQTFLFKRPIYVDLDVTVKDQNLADLTPFFNKNDGIQFNGKLVDGTGHVRVRGEKLQSSIAAKYDGFDLKFAKTADRSKLLTFFMNLGSALVINKDNEQQQSPEHFKTVDLEQDAGESLVSFMLRGLKEAALRVASSNQTRRHNNRNE